MNTLKNNTPAKEWIEGYPIGSGRLAAMVWDKDNSDVLSLNHEWLWRGFYRNQESAPSSHLLAKVREGFKTLPPSDATRQAVELLGRYDTNTRVDPYQPAGDLIFSFSSENTYISRELDIVNAVATVKRKNIQSEFYADCVKDLIVCKWISDREFDGEISFVRSIDENAVYDYNISDDEIEFRCRFDSGSFFGVKIRYITDGIVVHTDKGACIKSATYVYAAADIGTEKKGVEAELVYKDYDFENDKIHHTNKFSSLMQSVSFELDGCDEFDTLTIAERLQRLREGKKDKGIAKLFFDYGRYLMLSCSLTAELPANLQGKWNKDINPPWNCDYHFDINLQMNYWMCEAANMPECITPLIDYLVRIGENGRFTAKNRYGCRGTLLPLSDDAWAEALPVSREYGIWVGAASWMAQHLWWHFTYTNDIAYLEQKAYPYFKAVAEFYEDFLEADENGIFQIIPGHSPENRYKGDEEFEVSLGISSANDVQLCYDGLNYAIKSAQILGVDTDKIAIWQNIINHLPPFAIGNDGRLLEWNEEKIELEPGHKHLSHLYGVYPSDIFTEDKNPEQYAAARKSLDFRISAGGGYTGWSTAWVACMYARFGNADGFYDHLMRLGYEFATSSLLDLHPPGIFQIDGNFGATASIIEAVVSCVNGKVYLAKAIPDDWQSGSLCGIRLPGGHTIDICWESGRLKKVDIIFGFENEINIIANGAEKSYAGKNGEALSLNF